jgi:hypothetical protein
LAKPASVLMGATSDGSGNGEDGEEEGKEDDEEVQELDGLALKRIQVCPKKQ